MKKFNLDVNTGADELVKALEISKEIKALIYSPKTRDRLYSKIYIPKKDRISFREIKKPGAELKKIQRKLNKLLQSLYRGKYASVHGFLTGRSIITNALRHILKKEILNFDLSNFFPSINFGRVYGMLMGPEYKLKRETALLIAKICCDKQGLPQGAPTSPILSNMVCSKLDSELKKLVTEEKCTYTRYADDITISTKARNLPKKIVILDQKKKKISPEIIAIVENNDFKINNKKTHIKTLHDRQTVTGLVVNQKINVDRKYIRNTRGMLHAWEKYGIKLAGEKFAEKYYFRSSRLAEEKRETLFKKTLNGRINFIKQVKGKYDPTTVKLIIKYREIEKHISIEEKLIIEILKYYNCEVINTDKPGIGIHKIIEALKTFFGSETKAEKTLDMSPKEINHLRESQQSQRHHATRARDLLTKEESREKIKKIINAFIEKSIGKF